MNDAKLISDHSLVINALDMMLGCLATKNHIHIHEHRLLWPLVTPPMPAMVGKFDTMSSCLI